MNTLVARGRREIARNYDVVVLLANINRVGSIMAREKTDRILQAMKLNDLLDKRLPKCITSPPQCFS